MINKKIKKATDNFNKYRKPEAIAELISLKNNKIIIKFSGSFIKGCCVNDYFDDFVFELNNKIKIEKIEEKKGFYLAELCIKR